MIGWASYCTVCCWFFFLLLSIVEIFKHIQNTENRIMDPLYPSFGINNYVMANHVLHI